MIFIPVTDSCTPDNAGQFVLRKGWYLQGNNVASKGSISLDNCKKWCKAYAGCRSFDYEDANDKCYLHKVMSFSKGVQMKKGGQGNIYGELCSGMDCSYLPEDNVLQLL